MTTVIAKPKITLMGKSFLTFTVMLLSRG